MEIGKLIDFIELEMQIEYREIRMGNAWHCETTSNCPSEWRSKMK